MKSRVLIAIAAGVALVGVVWLAAGDRGGEATPALAAPPAKPEPTRALGPPDKAKVKLPPGANAAEVYGKLTEEADALAKRAMTGTPEEQARYFAEVEAKLTAFRARYPNTPESNDAAFQLGAMCYSIQKYDQAVSFLTEYLSKSPVTERQQQAYAHYYLAETYKGQGSYDKTEAEYKLLLSRYSDVNQRLTQLVQGNLDGLGAERKLAIGGEPVAFTVTSIDGKTLSPSAFKGKVLLIDFWATWCGPCVAEMPNVKKVYAKFHPRGFEIVGISLDQSRERLDQYLKTNEIGWPQYFDGKWWNNDVAVRYGIKSIPSTILVDRAGKIRYKSLRGKQLEAAVEQLLTEKS